MKNHQVVIKPIADLKPYERNTKKHPEHQIEYIAKSLKEFGWINPVLIDDHDVLIAGHARIEAAKLIGVKECPTIRISHLSDSQVRAYRIADNKMAEMATWDMPSLRVELSYLNDLDFDIDLTGFDDEYLVSLRIDNEDEIVNRESKDPWHDEEDNIVISQKSDVIQSTLILRFVEENEALRDDILAALKNHEIEITGTIKGSTTIYIPRRPDDFDQSERFVDGL